MTLLALEISTVVHLVCCEECETAANRKMVSDAWTATARAHRPSYRTATVRGSSGVNYSECS